MIKVTKDNTDQIQVGTILYFNYENYAQALEVVTEIDDDNFKARILWTTLLDHTRDSGPINGVTYGAYYIVA